MPPWRGRIVGHHGDIQRLCVTLPPTIAITEEPSGVWLADSAMDTVVSTDEARDYYAVTIKELDGLARIDFGSGYRGIRFGDVIRDETQQVGFLGIASEVDVAGELTVVGGSPPPPSKLPQRLEVIRGNPALADAVRALSDATTLPDLYKVYEAIKEGVGGGQREVEALLPGANQSERKLLLSRFTGSADIQRHYKSPAAQMTADRMSFKDGWYLMRVLLAAALDHLDGATNGAT